MKVVLFCGGLGMRLREFSDSIPKPMVTVGYRPIMWHVMKYYAHYGHKDFILCLGWKADYIKQYFLNYDECVSNDFVLSGGEPAAIALIDASVRLLPGVMGAEETLDEESFEAGLLEYPHYTRPAEWCGRAVPDVLMSGHHEKIKAWRKAQAERTTESRRPDLWAAYQKRPANAGQVQKKGRAS